MPFPSRTLLGNVPNAPGWISLSALCLLPLLQAACSFNVATPPARAAFYGSHRVLPAGESAFAAEGSAASKPFGPGLMAASLTCHRGWGGNRDLMVTPAAGRGLALLHLLAQ
jgi:hypothetical protein